MGIIMKDGHQFGVGGIEQADDISYDNTQSGMTATNVQEAVDELSAGLTHLQCGRVNITQNAQQVSTTINFPEAYSATPTILVTLENAGGYPLIYWLNNAQTTTTSVVVNTFLNSFTTSFSATINWMAFENS